jgi:hypothetical protein
MSKRCRSEWARRLGSEASITEAETRSSILPPIPAAPSHALSLVSAIHGGAADGRAHDADGTNCLTTRLDQVGLASRSGNAAEERRMTKRKANKPHKPDGGTTSSAKRASTPKRAVGTPSLTGSEGKELQAVPDTETRLPVLAVTEVVGTLPRVPPAELESGPGLLPHLAEPAVDAVLPVVAWADAKESVRAATVEATTSSPAAGTDGHKAGPLPGPLAGPLGAMASVEACRTLFMEMARDNLDFAANLAAMRSPLDIIDVAAKFAGSQIGMYGRFSKAVVDIAAGRQAPGA